MIVDAVGFLAAVLAASACKSASRSGPFDGSLIGFMMRFFISLTVLACSVGVGNVGDVIGAA